MIALRGLVRRYDASSTIGPIDLEIADGARIALLGSSGCGKSTLLRMLIGLVAPDAGHIEVGGERLDARTLPAFRRRVGYVTQDGALWPHMTCEENVVLWPREVGWPKDRIAARMAELCAMVRLSATQLERYPFQLSGGQRQRVALMRALALGPELLLLDEPLAALDPVTRVELQVELAELVRSLSATIVVVSHDVQEASRLADEMVLMREGRIEQKGTLERLREAPKNDFVRKFLAAIVLVVMSWVLATPAHAETPVRVGSKRFPESMILGEIAVAVLQRAGVAAEHRSGLGGTAIVWSALREGAIDVYVEYTGTLVRNLVGDDRRLDDAELARLLDAQSLAVLPHLGFENTYALAVKPTGNTAALRTMSQLAGRSDLRLGLSHEFLGRQDGWLGLCARYDICTQPTSGLDHGIAYDALQAGSIDVTDAYATDAKIDRLGLRVLDDDRGFFPKYHAMLVHRRDLAPNAVAALATLGGRIPAETMRSLNAAVELDGHTPSAAARRFVDGLDARGGGVAVKSSFLSGVIAVVIAEGPRHLLLVFVSLAAAILCGVPLGVAAHDRRRLGRWILGLAGVAQTIPSLALLSFMIPLFGIGVVPALVALFVYALLPIVRNTYVGLQEVPTAQREAALVMNLSKRTRLLRIELPLASRTILAGVKTSAVINVGTATIAAFIGAGGFGVAISTGLGLSDTRMILQGAVPAALLALILEGVFALGDRALIPRGVRLAEAAARRR